MEWHMWRRIGACVGVVGVGRRRSRRTRWVESCHVTTLWWRGKQFNQSSEGPRNERFTFHMWGWKWLLQWVFIKRSFGIILQGFRGFPLSPALPLSLSSLLPNGAKRALIRINIIIHTYFHIDSISILRRSSSQVHQLDLIPSTSHLLALYLTNTDQQI